MNARNRPGVVPEAASKSFARDTPSVPQSNPAAAPVLYRFEAIRTQLGPFASRMLEDLMLQQLPASWERRARDFESARPRPTDFTGTAQHGAIAAKDRELAEIAAACRERAQFLRTYPDVMAEIVAEDVALAMSEGVAS